MINDILRETEQRMRKATSALEADYRSVRTGRASPALLDRVKVNYYGTQTPLKQLAVISVPEPHMLLVRPYDAGSLEDIEKGILQADLGLNPNNDGRVIRLPIPRLTEERRRDLTKVVRRRLEEAKVALRNIRRDALEDLREFESEKLISEDEFERGKDRLQELTDAYTEKIEEIAERKEKEIMEV